MIQNVMLQCHFLITEVYLTLYETSIKGCQDETRNRLEKCINNLKAIFNSGSLKEMPFERLGFVDMESEAYKENDWTRDFIIH